MPPPIIPNERPSEPPYLNPTASWYTGDAWFLFANIIDSCGYPTAKFIFEKCIKEGAEIEAAKAKRVANAQRRAAAAPMKIPTIAQIDAAGHSQICIWWERLRSTEQKFDSASEKESVDRIQARYIEFGGYPKDYTEGKLPPIPQKRNHDDAALVAMFDRSNPQSPYSIAREKRGGKLKTAEFAASLVPEFGTSAGHIMRKVKYLRIGR
jgi:hypothetical protein